jgi:hypothetical protein
MISIKIAWTTYRIALCCWIFCNHPWKSEKVQNICSARMRVPSYLCLVNRDKKKLPSYRRKGKTAYKFTPATTYLWLFIRLKNAHNWIFKSLLEMRTSHDIWSKCVNDPHYHLTTRIWIVSLMHIWSCASVVGKRTCWWVCNAMQK